MINYGHGLAQGSIAGVRANPNQTHQLFHAWDHLNSLPLFADLQYHLCTVRHWAGGDMTWRGQYWVSKSQLNHIFIVFWWV